MMTIEIDGGYEAACRTDQIAPGGETAITVCLVAVPVIWTALIMGMLGCGVASIGSALVMATLAGVATGAMRRVWLARRRANDDHHLVPHWPYPIG